MIQLILLSLSIIAISAIKFSYHLPAYQVQCFHQSVQQNSRFQITVRGDSSSYYLHVVDKKPLHEDTRTVNAQYKYFSAFAQASEILTFCLGNLDANSIYFDIEFYHGMFLEDSFQTKIKDHELQDLSDRWSQMIKLIESNYEIYKNRLMGQRATGKRITLYLRVMMGVIIVGTVLIKVLYFSKIKSYLREKKVV